MVIVMEMKIGNSILKIDDDTKAECEMEQKQRVDGVVKLIIQNHIHTRESEERQKCKTQAAASF